MELLTNRAVEERLLKRLRKKAEMFGNDWSDDTPERGNLKVSVDTLVDLYERYIIPLTKEVEVDYLLTRLDSI